MTTIHGTHQDPIGDILRHLFFNLVMNDLEDRLNDEVTKFGVDTKSSVVKLTENSCRKISWYSVTG